MAYIITFFAFFVVFILLMSFIILAVPKTTLFFEFTTLEFEDDEEYVNEYFSFLLSGLSKDYIIKNNDN